MFSGYAADRLRAGDVLDVMTPSGTFSTPLDAANAKRYVAVAAGSGITPVLSILATALEVEPLSTAALIYVNRRTSTIMFLEELEDLKNRFPERFQLIHVLGQEMTEVEMLSGRLDVERLGRILDTIVPVDDVDEWFLCGPLAMTDSVRGVLLERDVDTAHVHRELFHVGAPITRRRPAADPGTPVTGIEGHRHPGRPIADLHPAAGRGLGAGRDPPGPPGRPVRLQERRLRHLPGQSRRRKGGDGLELRARTRRARPRVRADLPVPPGHRPADSGLRPVTRTPDIER